MKCGMRSAECGIEATLRAAAATCLSLRTPHSALRTRRARRGLAPLELVLALPLLLMVMALMIVFGNAAFWKVRGLSVARHAAWSNRWPRTGADESMPNPWTPANYARRTAADLDVLDIRQMQQPAVRGPLDNGFDVNDELLDPSRGVVEGHAQGQIEPAMMPKMKAFQFTLKHSMIDDKFQYPQMGIPANVHRRIPFIYTLPKANAGVSQAWVSAALAVRNSPLKPALAPLDNDEEMYAYYGHAPDFHPRLTRFCSLDLNSAWENQTRQLIGRIKGRQRPRTTGVPERMANAWIALYTSQIREMESQTVPPQGQIDALKAKVQTLETFRNRARQMPDTPDGPVPPLAAFSPRAGSVAAHAAAVGNRDPYEPPPRPIPAVLLNLISPKERACCGPSPTIHELLRLLESASDLEELP